jgi:hypothetical protein
MSAIFALVLYGIISHLPIPWEFRLSIWLISVLCVSCCCVKKYATPTIMNRLTRIENITVNRIQPGFGTGTRNRTVGIQQLGSVVERFNLSSSTHTRTNIYEIPTISRPFLEDFSLQRLTSLQGPCWDVESRVAESNRLPISLSVPFSEPSNSVVANAPSAAPIEWPLSLPSYDDVINQPNYKIEEEPPPTYDEIVC